MEPLKLETHRPPEAPIDMPYQVIERQQAADRSWLALLRQMMARQAPHE
jgi:hypothetical protein